MPILHLLALDRAADAGVMIPNAELRDDVTGLMDRLRAAELLSALEEGRFLLYGQPIVPLQPESALSLHYEILLRMRDHQGAPVPPASFILAAERYDVTVSLDRRVIRAALRRYRSIADALPGGIAINLSARSLSSRPMFEFLQRELAESTIPSPRICFEITETAAISDLSRARRLIAELKETGCRFALDDFGSGHSSFACLKSLPVDFLKIDGSYVRDLLHEPFDHAFVEAICRLGHRKGVRIVAEGVEDARVLARLRELGIDYAQGFAVGHPRPLEHLAVAA